MNPNAINEMFEEVKLLLIEIKKKIEKQQTASDNQEVLKRTTELDDEIIYKIVDPISEAYQLNMVNIINCLENQNTKYKMNLNSTVEEISAIVKEDTHQYQHHSIEFKSSKVVITFIVLFLMSIGFFVYNIIQYTENQKLQNNDIKYRCVKAMGGINKSKLYELEKIFNNLSSKERQEEIRQEVIDYEAKVQKETEEIEQANLKEQQAKKLTKEVEKLRGKR